MLEKNNQPTLQGVELKIVPQNLYLYNQEFAPKTLTVSLHNQRKAISSFFICAYLSPGSHQTAIWAL